MLERAEQIVRDRRQADQGGVYVCESDEEFDELRKLPYVGPGEVGYLIVPKQQSLEEWLLAHPPAEPIQDPKKPVL